MSDTEKIESSTTKTIKRARLKPRKALPTDRVTFVKQLDILRAAAAASGPGHKPVSNEDIAKVVNIHYGSISNCNPFFLEAGLLSRQKHQNMPSEEVFAYAEKYEWEPEKAALKLAPAIRKTWFCSTLIPKLTFRSLQLDEAISFLADEIGATKEYRDQLAMLIEYMRVSGIVSVDGNVVNLLKSADEDESKNNEDKDKQSPPPNPNAKDRLADREEPIHHPFIEGLIKTLPKPETNWSVAGRMKWLQAASNIFGLIYQNDPNNVDEITIAIKKNKTENENSNS